MNLRTISFLGLTALLALQTSSLKAGNATKAGTFHVEHPTLLNLGFEWPIEGDDNRNATVAVTYRAVGETKWREALPLMRIGGENIARAREGLDYHVPQGFAGSILNLQPGTEYECKFVMSDPDGVTGDTTQQVKVKTRTEPMPYQGGKVFHCYPPDYTGPRETPSYTGILPAYYGAGLGDWSVVWEHRVQPGDTLLLHSGRYKNDRLSYVDPMTTPFDGTMNLTLKGTPEKPITIKAAGDGEVIIDGDGNHVLFDVMASQYNLFEGITFQNTDIVFLAGKKEEIGAVGLTVKNCRFESVGFAVWTEYAGSSDFYIADNLIIGRDERFRMLGWGSPAHEPNGPSWPVPPLGSHQLHEYYGIKIYGTGHVIAHNAIAYFHDAIGISTYGTPESDPDRRASAIDIYENDIHLMNDDFVETDGGVHNVRVFNNRGVNANGSAWSVQPSFGGPIYIYKNISYNANPFKFVGNPCGIYVFNNTVLGEPRVSTTYNMRFLNNLFLARDTTPSPPVASDAADAGARRGGRGGGRGSGGVFQLGSLTPNTTTDYNGFRPNRGVTAGQYSFTRPASWESTQATAQTFATLKEYQAGTGQEQHSIEVDYDIFEKVFPSTTTNRHAVYHAMDLNFALKPGSKAIDAGIVIPTVNEDFTGRAPDLGALESGKPAPHYGPRWITWEPFYR